MSNAKIWNGAAYVDVPGKSRAGAGADRFRLGYWNGSAYVYVWEKPMPYQVNTTSNISGSGTSYNGWGSGSPTVSSGYPYTILDSGIRIPALCPAFTAVVRAQGDHSGGISPRYTQLRLKQNGTVIAEGAQSTGSPGTASVESSVITIQPGDLITAEWRGEGQFFSRPALQSGAWLRVTPQ
ncbi:MAG: hypothetical protein QM658_09675 [Gordonia sp. (in: high G+C Gram-positive bacteria)]